MGEGCHHGRPSKPIVQERRQHGIVRILISYLTEVIATALSRCRVVYMTEGFHGRYIEVWLQKSYPSASLYGS